MYCQLDNVFIAWQKDFSGDALRNMGIDKLCKILFFVYFILYYSVSFVLRLFLYSNVLFRTVRRPARVGRPIAERDGCIGGQRVRARQLSVDSEALCSSTVTFVDVYQIHFRRRWHSTEVACCHIRSRQDFEWLLNGVVNDGCRAPCSVFYLWYWW